MVSMTTSHTSYQDDAAAYAVRGRRQTVAILAAATLLGLWLGTSAPGVSPVVAPPPAVTTTVAPAAAAPAPANPAPAGPGPNGVTRPGGRRR
jgi:hypothetical protein